MESQNSVKIITEGSQKRMSVRAEIIAQLEEVSREQNRQLAPLNDDLPLLNSGLDSLCLAVIVARLEDKLGVDPFSTADDLGFPVTFGDFVKFYESVSQSSNQQVSLSE